MSALIMWHGLEPAAVESLSLFILRLWQKKPRKQLAFHLAFGLIKICLSLRPVLVVCDGMRNFCISSNCFCLALSHTEMLLSLYRRQSQKERLTRMTLMGPFLIYSPYNANVLVDLLYIMTIQDNWKACAKLWHFMKVMLSALLLLLLILTFYLRTRAACPLVTVI